MLLLLVLCSCLWSVEMMPLKSLVVRPTTQATRPKVPMASIVTRAQGTVYEWQNDVITVRLTGEQTQGLYTLTEDAMKPTFNLGLHLHRKHAETFYILEGQVEFRVGTQTHLAEAGTTIHVPPGTPHGARVINGKPARMIMLYAPAGFEEFLKEMKSLTNTQLNDEKFMRALSEKHDSIPLE